MMFSLLRQCLTTASIAVSLFLTCASSYASAQEPFTCRVKVSDLCSKSLGGCSPSSHGLSTVSIDWTRKIYSRCDSDGCLNYDFELIRSSPAVSEILVGDVQFHVRVTMGEGSEFFEVDTQSFSPTVSFGRCTTLLD